jgi:hypothetical protein
VTTPIWRNRPLADNDHAIDLDKQVTEHTSKGFDQDVAEEAVYQKYRKQQHLQAAAFHIGAASRMARAGQKQDADKHHALYRLHLSAGGLRNGLKVPDEVMAMVPTTQSASHQFFQNHGADRLVTK